MVHEVATVEELTKLLSEPGLVLVDYFAVWCGPCKAIAPKVDTLSGEYPNIKFVKVDVDKLESHPEVVSVEAMPTFRLYKDGVKVAEMKGANYEKLVELIKSST